MDPAQEAFLRSTVGLLAHVANELVAAIGAINAGTVNVPEIQEGMTELNAVLTRVLESFPPPAEIFH
jgi:hypothetical protein